MKKLKLDENFPPAMAEIFREYGIDTSSVHEQLLHGVHDDNIFEVCKEEQRTLITFDLDFANIIRYPALGTSGILIVRSRRKMNLDEIVFICHKLSNLILQYELNDNLFIVEDTKIRIRKPED